MLTIGESRLERIRMALVNKEHSALQVIADTRPLSHRSVQQDIENILKSR